MFDSISLSIPGHVFHNHHKVHKEIISLKTVKVNTSILEQEVMEINLKLRHSYLCIGV